MKDANDLPRNAFGEETIWRLAGDALVPQADVLIHETPLVLVVDGTEFASAVVTPGDEELWAAGHLACRGLIENRSDIESVRVEPGRVLIALAATERPILTREPFVASWRTTPQAVFAGIEWLASAPLFKRTGCAHVAALLTPEGEKLFRIEDVGRHNAVDKAVGWMIRNDLRPENLMLMLSGRLPEDMVAKAAFAGIPLAASISAATEQGVRAARNANLTLIGFARNGTMNVYSAPERLFFA